MAATKTLTRIALVAGMACSSAAAAAPKPQDNAEGAPSTWLAAMAEESSRREPAAQPAAWRKPLPVTFTIDYTVVTDYIFRGINFSEYAGEGREKLNHQLGVGVSVDAGAIGTFAVGFWFEWYADQEVFNAPGDGDHLQEVDYVVSWSKELPEIFTTVEIGWVAYTFPQLGGDPSCTHEPYVKLSFNDGPLFGRKDGVLNPYVYYGIDVDDGQQGSWLEIGVEHEFALAEMGCKNVPVLRHLSVTPSLVLGIDHRYLDKFAGAGGGPSTRLANLVYGLAVSYDVSGALGLPQWAGSLTLTGFVNFSQAFRRSLLNDELYGGFTVAYEW